MAFGITAIGAYLPRYRLERAAIAAAHRWMAPSLAGAAKGRRAFCAWDEDAITMAVEAGRAALRGQDASLDRLVLASTRLPYADFQNASIVASALDLGPSLATSDVTGSQRAATSALIAALDSGRGQTLVIASDKPRAKPASTQELQYGAGAGAVLVGEGEPIATLLGHASVSTPFADHFRPSDRAHDYFWEERWIRDEGYAAIVPQAVTAALGNAGLTSGDVTRLVMPSLLRGAGQLVAKAIGFKGTIADGLEADCGHAGAAHPFLMLAAALEEAEIGDKILLIGFGQGADALVLEVTGRPSSAARGMQALRADAYVTSDYLRMLSFYGDIELEWGMRAEKQSKPALTEIHRNDHQLSAFNAGKCPACGTIQFPQLAYCVTPGCATPSAKFEAVSLADEPAKLLTFTADWLSYHPAPPLYVGFVEFANGARLLMETVDAPASAVDVGMPLRMVFRIKERDAARGFNRYFWKATPINL